MDALSLEDEAWRAAYYIAYVGASNIGSVARTLVRFNEELGEDHAAVRAIQGHHDYLEGIGLGPEDDELAEVEANAKRLGLIPSQTNEPDGYDRNGALDFGGVVSDADPGL
jgi:hypothetical protein